MQKFILPILIVCNLAVLLSTASEPFGPVPPAADHRIAKVQVSVTVDDPDWTLEVGEHAGFLVRVLADQMPLDGVEISYVVGPEMMHNARRTAVVPAEGLRIDGGTMTEPGFIRCTAYAQLGGRKYRGAATAGFSPEKIRPTQVDPGDFDAFWTKGKEELAAIPMAATMVPLHEVSTEAVNVYHVSFRNAGESWSGESRIFGIYCEPAAPGEYPAILAVPGAGVRPYAGQRDYAAAGAITLEIGIHGIPVNMPQNVYDSLRAGALSGYPIFNLDDPKKYYYRRVILGCIRSNDFLTSREKWNGEDLLVMGASQGGYLSLATTALDDRVTGLAVTHPAFSDVTGYLHDRAGGWPHMFRSYDENAPSIHATEAKIRTTRYFDSVNFARRIDVPGFYIWGYNDVTCPPTSMFAAYNEITAPKELTLILETGHEYWPEQHEATRRWVLNFLDLE